MWSVAMALLSVVIQSMNVSSGVIFAVWVYNVFGVAFRWTVNLAFIYTWYINSTDIHRPYRTAF